MARERAVLVDGHVHLHARHDIDVALDSAVANLDEAAAEMGLQTGVRGMLWLVEGAGEGAAGRLRSLERGRWTTHERGEHLLDLRRTDDRTLTVVLGHQVRTREDLEVLVVGTSPGPEHGLGLEATIEGGLQGEGLVMLPWSFGKWTGSRGRAIGEAFQRYAPMGVRLADTAAHARMLRDPGVFRQSVEAHLPILAGTDPFPFRTQVRAIGRYGFVLDFAGADLTWSEILPAVRDHPGQPVRFGNPMGSLEFAMLQTAMQVRKRLG